MTSLEDLFSYFLLGKFSPLGRKTLVRYRKLNLYVIFYNILMSCRAYINYLIMHVDCEVISNNDYI